LNHVDHKGDPGWINPVPPLIEEKREGETTSLPPELRSDIESFTAMLAARAASPLAPRDYDYEERRRLLKQQVASLDASRQTSPANGHHNVHDLVQATEGTSGSDSEGGDAA
jgi:hypothetical protein